MKKHLIVAGCSFSAFSQTKPGTSWSEVLAKKLDWDLTNLARQGCSNGGIRVQIEEIRRQKPDFAIVSPTFWDRMEIQGSAWFGGGSPAVADWLGNTWPNLMTMSSGLPGFFRPSLAGMMGVHAPMGIEQRSEEHTSELQSH